MLNKMRTVARFLLLPLMIAAGSLTWILRENQDLAQFRAELESDLETYYADSESTRMSTISALDALSYMHDFAQVPPTRSDSFILRTAHLFFERRLQRPLSSLEELSDRIIDLNYYIQAAWKLRKFHEAEDAIDELLQLAVETQEITEDSNHVLIRALNWKSCLQVNYREPEAALETVRECISKCQVLLRDRPDDQTLLQILARAYRNAGVIEEVLGRDGARSVRRAAEIAVATPEAGPDRPVNDQLAGPVFLVDTLQLLGYQHLHHGRVNEAIEAWQQGLEQCRILAEQADRLAHAQGVAIPVRRFRRGQDRLETDLFQLQSIRDERELRAPPGPATSGSAIAVNNEAAARVPLRQWTWTPLRPGDGLSELSVDRLVKSTLPGEFEPQEAILLSWAADMSWSHATLLEMVRAIQETTLVVLLVPDDEVREELLQALKEEEIPPERVEILMIQTDTIWVRDYGPLTVRCADGAVRIASSMFKDSFEDPAPGNDFFPVNWSRSIGWPAFRLPVLIEAGAVLSNGAGICVASEYLLRKNAASGINEKQVTAALQRLTGAESIVYLTPLLDEQTGHVDWFSVFTAHDTVVIGDYYGLDEVNSRILDDNAARLAGVMTRNGPLKVERIPMPPRGRETFGGTYTNVVFANGNLLVPTWPEASKSQEEKALSVYRRLLPGWKIIPINSHELGRKEGSLHCATMNLYRYRPPEFQAGSGS
jgi:agmatine/peptidylarginine deiminase/tetratricopeptide (TPR) repeat protein